MSPEPAADATTVEGKAASRAEKDQTRTFAFEKTLHFLDPLWVEDASGGIGKLARCDLVRVLAAEIVELPHAEDRKGQCGGQERHRIHTVESPKKPACQKHLFGRAHENQHDEVLPVQERRERDRDQTDRDPDDGRH